MITLIVVCFCYPKFVGDIDEGVKLCCHFRVLGRCTEAYSLLNPLKSFCDWLHTRYCNIYVYCIVDNSMYCESDSHKKLNSEQTWRKFVKEQFLT